MTNYFCSRCSYETNKKGSFIKHLNRKNICKPKLADISIDEIKEQNNLNYNKSQILNVNKSNTTCK